MLNSFQPSAQRNGRTDIFTTEFSPDVILTICSRQGTLIIGKVDEVGDSKIARFTNILCFSIDGLEEESIDVRLRIGVGVQ